MIYQLRPYQRHAVDRGLHLLQANTDQHGLIVAPAGSGKSLIIANIVTQLPGRCLVFQPSKEILEQNANKLLAYGYEPAVFSASFHTREIGPITLATIGSVRRTPELFADIPYVIIDECHFVNAKEGMYRDFLATMRHSRILGLTATPFRLNTDGYGGSMLKFLTRTRPRVFSLLVHVTQIPDLVSQGYLVKPTYQVVSGFERQALEVNTTGADYTDESVKRYYNRTGFADRLRRVIFRCLEVGRRNVLVFTRFIEEAEALVEAVPGTGVVTAETDPAMRAAIVRGFRSGEIRVVANVGVLATGFDYPELDTVILARPTLSLALHMQQIGRVVRPSPTKADAWVVDMVDQVRQFGPLEDLVLTHDANGSWIMASRGRQLTNIYFGGGRFQRGRPFRGRQFRQHV